MSGLNMCCIVVLDVCGSDVCCWQGFFYDWAGTEDAMGRKVSLEVE